MVDMSTPLKIATEVDRLSQQTVAPLLMAIGKWPSEFQCIIIRAAIRKLEQHVKGLP
jgi:hypothetical protein